jgi:O-antigen/teichoic acid export membrane protein
MIHLFLFGILLLIPFSHFEWMMYSYSCFKALFWTFFVRQLVTLLLLFAALIWKGKLNLNELVVYYIAGIAAGTLIGYRFVKMYLTHSFQLRSLWVHKLWHFGKYVFGSGVSTLVFANAGGMMLSPILGSTVYTASQSIAARVLNLADMPSQVLSDILFPKSASSEIAGNKHRIKYYYEKTVGATICFALPVIIFVLLFPKFIIRILADEQYYDAAPFLQVTAVTVLFLAFLKQWAVIIDSGGRPQINFYTISGMAVLNVVLSYFMIVQGGFMGAAWALVLTHVIGFILTQILLKKYYDISILMCFVYAFRFYPEIFQIVKEKIQPKWKTHA